MSKIKTLLIEDEKISLITLQSLLHKHFEEIEVVGTAGTVRESKEKIKSLHPDLIFLDISLPDGEGFEVLNGLERKSFEVIFTTAHEQYALKAFDFFAIHYLVKPVTFERLNTAIDRYQELRKSDEFNERLLQSDAVDLSELIAHGENNRLEFKSSFRWDYRENKVNKKLEEVILKSIAAFSNAKGGVLFIGVDDSGNTIGLEKDFSTFKQANKDHFELHLRNLVNTEYGVPFTTNNLNVSFPLIRSKEVCMIEIRQGLEPVYTTVTDKSGSPVERFYVRSGNTSQELIKPSRIMTYIKARF